MKKYSLNQKGFSAIEGILILVIVGLVGSVGYFVYHSQQQTNKTLTNAQSESSSTLAVKKSTTTSTKSTSASTGKTSAKAESTTVSLESGGQSLETIVIPNSWTIKVAHSSVDASARVPTCSITVQNSLTSVDRGSAIPTSLANSAYFPEVEFDIAKQPDNKSLQSYFTDDLYGGYDSGIHTFSSLTINNNEALVYNGSGKSDGSDYKTQYYLVSHNGYVACLRWRSFDAGPPAQDYSKYQTDVQTMANSIKFSY